jgi:DNA-binding CsgD family transcriptional regulator
MKTLKKYLGVLFLMSIGSISAQDADYNYTFDGQVKWMLLTDTGTLLASTGEALVGIKPNSGEVSFKIDRLETLKLLRDPTIVEKKEDLEQLKLSQREIDVLEQLSTGLKYNEIARNLIISPATVRKHLENIYKKLQVHNKMEAVIKARKHKLI